MVQTKTKGSVTDYILLSSDKSNTNALGVFTNQEEAYGAALANLMQHVETNINKWPKSLVVDNQSSINQVCQQIKDLATYKERFEYLSSNCKDLFKEHLHIEYQVLPALKPEPINESIFKIKVRNFLDVLQTRSDVEEDLNSEDDDDDEEEEEEEEEYASGEEAEEEEVDEEDLEEDDEEEEPRTSETVNLESEEEDDEEEEESSLKRKSSVLEEEDEDEEDEIDEDELEDEDDTTKKRKTSIVA